MKFMGSKRWMLGNGLGQLLSDSARGANRFVDLFTGSAAVASFVATRFEIPVVAADLQHFSIALAGATIHRDKAVATTGLWTNWCTRARSLVRSQDLLTFEGKLTKKKVEEARAWCADRSDLVVTSAYGGHYFSPTQAIWIDAFRQSLPKNTDERAVALAALIEVASKCAASPGHTAQPFQPTKTAKVFLEDAWNRDVSRYLQNAIEERAGRHALRKGKAIVKDALSMAKTLNKRDVAFIDPPYSGVHYSRFYHVLETIAVGSCGEVSGTGRYPAIEHRPRSEFSMKSTSYKAMEKLLAEIAKTEALAIITFPDHECSNGLSGEDIRGIAKTNFTVTEKVVRSKFSTLGGTKSDSVTGNNRTARHSANELILKLTPR